MQVTKSIKIDLVEKGVQPIVYAKQNDRQTRFIAASLFANGQPFSVPDGVVAVFRAGKPDGTACFYDSNETGTPAITIEGNLVTVELAEQVLTAPGNVQAEINFYTAGGEKLTSFSFAIQVEKSVLTDQEIVSSDYYNVLTAQIKAAQDAAQSAQTSAWQAEQALQEVEQLANTVSGTIQQAGQTQVSNIQQAGQEQITAVQQAGAQQTAAAAAEADRARGYAESINPAQFVKTVNGTGPDASGNVEVQAGVASVFGRTGEVIAQEGDYNAGQIEETASRVFVSPQEKAKWNSPGDIINGTLSVWQRYNAADSSTYTNPSNAYIADRFRANGNGTVQPNERGYGADITGTITMQYWMEKTDFALLPDPVIVYYSVDGVMQSTSTAKASVQTDSDGNACIFSRTITNQTLDWVSLYPGRPVRPYAEEMELCRRYYKFINRFQSSVNEYNTAGKQVIVVLNGLNMRVIPTVSLKGTPNQPNNGGYYIGVADGGGIIPNMTFSVIPVTVDLVQIRAAFGGNQTVSMNYIISFTLGAGIAIDAEIY